MVARRQPGFQTRCVETLAMASHALPQKAQPLPCANVDPSRVEINNPRHHASPRHSGHGQSRLRFENISRIQAAIWKSSVSVSSVDFAKSSAIA